MTKLALSLEEAAESVSLSTSYLRREIRAGRLRAKQVGQKYRIGQSDLAAWFESLNDA